MSLSEQEFNDQLLLMGVRSVKPMYDQMGQDVGLHPLDTMWELEMSRESVVCLAENMINHANNLTKSVSLYTVLHDNPGLLEQWDEMLVMLKLAGFDDQLVVI